MNLISLSENPVVIRPVHSPFMIWKVYGITDDGVVEGCSVSDLQTAGFRPRSGGKGKPVSGERDGFYANAEFFCQAIDRLDPLIIKLLHGSDQLFWGIGSYAHRTGVNPGGAHGADFEIAMVPPIKGGNAWRYSCEFVRRSSFYDAERIAIQQQFVDLRTFHRVCTLDEINEFIRTHKPYTFRWSPDQMALQPAILSTFNTGDAAIKCEFDDDTSLYG